MVCPGKVSWDIMCGSALHDIMLHIVTADCGNQQALPLVREEV